VPTLAAAVRRLRDAGRGWAELLWLLVPVAGLVLAAMRLSEPSRVPSSSLPLTLAS
jgi:uncharacterized membrane protein YhaH (DUF805 family)